MYCSNCGEKNIEEAKFCLKCGNPLIFKKSDTESRMQSRTVSVPVIEALKSTNTCCLWISLDYWNLYFYEDKAMAVRVYRGWWGLILAIIGLFGFLFGSLFSAIIGVLIDKNIGEAKCHLARGELQSILNNRAMYKIIEVPISQLKKGADSDLCLGNIWLKYMVELNRNKFYFENFQFEQLEKILESLQK